MKRRPVGAYAAPAYPTRAELGREPSLLEEHVPPSWHRLDAAIPGVVVMLVAAATAGCPKTETPSGTTPSERIGSTRPGADAYGPQPSGERAGTSGPVTVDVAGPPPATDTLPPAADRAAPAEAPDAMVVAPLFEHGEGRGAVGCVVVAPPVFLSEQEALSIVREELARQGIALGTGSLPVDGVSISEQRTIYQSGPGGTLGRQTVPVDGTARQLELDAVAPEQHVAVEVVSRESYFQLGGEHSGSSVQGYDLKGVAASLVERLRKDGKQPLYVGVFYDPVATLDLRSVSRSGGSAAFEAARDSLRRESADQLRDQVRDFASWLRGKAVL